MDANCGNKEKHSWLKTGSSNKVELTIGFAELFNTDRKTKTTDLNYFHLSWHNTILLTSTKAVFPGKDLTINYAALKWTPEVKFCSAFLSSCLHCCFCSAYLKTPETSRTLFQIKSLVKNLNGAHFSGFVLLFSCVKLRGTWLWNDLSEWVGFDSFWEWSSCSDIHMTESIWALFVKNSFLTVRLSAFLQTIPMRHPPQTTWFAILISERSSFPLSMILR